MPIGLPTKRSSRPVKLTEWEREKIIEWLIEGCTIIEIYHRCADEGFPPPSEQAITYHLRSERVQSALRERRKAERQYSISSFVRRTQVREELLGRIAVLMSERAEENAGFTAGGATGLVTLADKKSVIRGRTADSTDYETYDIYKADTALMSELRAVLRDQDESDARLLHLMRHKERHDVEMESRLLDLEVADIELTALKALVQPPAEEQDSSSDNAENLTDGSSEQDTGDTGENPAPFAIQYEEQDRA